MKAFLLILMLAMGQYGMGQMMTGQVGNSPGKKVVIADNREANRPMPDRERPMMERERPLGDSIRMVIDSSVALLREFAYHRDKPDWELVRQEAFDLARQAVRWEDLGPAMAHLFEAVDDHHGWLALRDTLLQWPRHEPPYLSPALKQEFAKGNRIVKNLLPGGIGYLRVPGMAAESSEYNRLAQRLMDSLCALQREGARKWIIDLRLNAGGTMLPMIAGLSPLLGNGAFLGYADNRGKVTGMTRLKDGKFSSPDGGVAEVVGADGRGARKKGARNTEGAGGSEGAGGTEEAGGAEEAGRSVGAGGSEGAGRSLGAGRTEEAGGGKEAGKGIENMEQAGVVILTGHGTGSAGECVAVAFKGRPHTWFIGEPTAGYTTGNKGHVLVGGRVEIVIAESVLVDRRHRVYPRNLIPDEWVPGGEDFSDYEQDKKIQAALRRLGKN
ncbi:MAG TPA: S41 family peptidase [Puia sp.]|nr:S41 family peptidase [Puia sp.]